MSSSQSSTLNPLHHERDWSLRSIGASSYTNAHGEAIVLDVPEHPLHQPTGGEPAPAADGLVPVTGDLRDVLDVPLRALTKAFLRTRGVATIQDLAVWRESSLDLLTPPTAMMDASRAMDRIIQAQRQSVLIFGDYDVDGTTGAALLLLFLQQLGFSQVRAEQPDRFRDGYGLNVNAVERAASDGVQLLLTVDNGITAFEPIRRARELGIDVIVIDHHQIDLARGMPDGAYAIVNPQRADDTSGLRMLCGCGVAFTLVRGLRTRAHELGWFAGESALPVPNLRDHLDLVALATAADMVPLVGENRIFMRHGLEVLKKTKKPGLRSLLQVSGVLSPGESHAKVISPSHLGFSLGPRINASGRLESASYALELLATSDEARGQELALKLESLNQERIQLQNSIWDEVKTQIEQEIEQGLHVHSVVVASERWHEGVIGIVASRVTERFHKPAVVLSIHEAERAKGSVRSFGGKNVLDGLRAAKEILLGFGGHHHAAGLSLAKDRISEFRKIFDEAMAMALEIQTEAAIQYDIHLSPGELDPEAFFELEGLGPFGVGNPEPTFRAEMKVREVKILKSRHVKWILEHPNLRLGMEAMWFYAPDWAIQNSVSGMLLDVLISPEINRFMGKTTPSLRVKDARKREDSMHRSPEPSFRSHSMMSFLLGVLCFLISGAMVSASTPVVVDASPVPLSVVEGSGSQPIDPGPAAESASPVPLTSGEVLELKRRFEAQLSSEFAALIHQIQKETNLRKEAHRSELAAFTKEESRLRAEFFAANEKGEDRRKFVSDSIARRKVKTADMERRKKLLESTQELRKSRMKEAQAQRRAAFRGSLEKKIRPPAELWSAP